ncbi:MAG: amidohydrolase family protein [Flavobacteriaceae bacterium]|nr:amidohydrolase family protein [Flavobacteriaceae bacterium]
MIYKNSKLYLRILFLCTLFSFINISAQEYFPKNDGVKSKNTNYTAFTNAKIYITPTQIIEKGTMLIKEGKVINAGIGLSIPKNATIIDLDGKSIYPSFIDVYSNFGIVIPKSKGVRFRQKPQYDSKRKGYYWNEHIRPETNAIDKFKYDDKKAIELRKAGFGIVNTHLQDGIIRGAGLLVTLKADGTNADRLLDDTSAQYLSFTKSKVSNQGYPTSLMGAMALLRQVYYDSDWYAKGNVSTKDLSLEALNSNKNLAQIFYANDKMNALRADKIGDLFNIQYTIVGKGNEYQLINEIKNTNATFILPVNFPKAYDVENPFQADYVNLSAMRYWNQAPSNPGVLAKNGVSFSFTTHHLKSLNDFNKNLQKAIEYGLDKTKALEALTTVPAHILRKSNQIGSLKKGMLANFLITSGDIFDKKTTLYENWVQGSKNIINDMNIKDIRGDYTLSLAGNNYNLTINGKPAKLNMKVKKDTVKINSKIHYSDDWLSIILTEDDKPKRLNAKVSSDSDNLNGKAILSNGNTVNWTATKKIADKKDDKKTDKDNKDTLTILPITFPNVGYGFKEKPKQETILFKNATVWTNEKDGILKNTDVLVKNGKIVKVGTNLSDKKAKIVDATGKHLTSGIIDEHSHIAAASINEAGHNSSAEVTIEDNIDSEDINIYRNLAGGVTTSQILHGSANPIGGRSAIIKLKWGEIGDNMIYSNSPKFIKFALGENVKQSNWGSAQTIRFPQTRMGVEQVYMDYFQRAKEYDVLKKSGKPYRKDIEMEVLAEILNKERFISCHSYVQSEINMLMKVAEKFDFNINTFTHILEGYKVADKMKAHGVGGSTFSDWWAYKYEVNDAIPYNAAIMHSVGVVTAINSDSREMSRRLNQEAAKSVKYGNVSEEDAWKFVTLNPAKLLHIDDRVGSIKVGKDADLVLWSDHPLSVYAKAEKTMIEGKVYFDIEKDKLQREVIKKERNQLINMMLNAKSKGAPTQAPKKHVKKELHCDSVDY